MSQLDDFLEAQREGPLESQGSFTIDPFKARETLSRYQLANPHYYLLKFVQAAVAAGSAQLHISLAPTVVRLGFLAPSPSPLDSTTRLFSALQNPPAQPERSLRHLAIGLNACLGVRTQEVEWMVRDRECGHHVVITDATARLKTGPGHSRLPPAQTLFQLLLRRVNHRDVMGWPRAEQMELHTLLQACRYCPLDLVVNGQRPADDSEPLDTWPLKEISDPFYVSRRLLPARADSPHFLMPTPPWSEMTPVTSDLWAWKGPGGWFRRTRWGTPIWLFQSDGGVTAGERVACRGALTLTYTGRPESCLRLVVDGVCLPEQWLSWHLAGLLAVWMGDGLQTDLSEFQVVDDRAYQELCAGIKLEGIRLRDLSLLHLSRIGVVRNGRPDWRMARARRLNSTLAIGLNFTGHLASLQRVGDWHLVHKLEWGRNLYRGIRLTDDTPADLQVHPNLDEPTTRRLLDSVRERRAHPGPPQLSAVLDFGEVEGGVFIACECILEGESVARRLPPEPLSPQEAGLVLRVLGEVFNWFARYPAVRFPILAEQVFLLSGRVRVLGFLPDPPPSPHAITGSALAGCYLAPEQITGVATHQDRTAQYLLGSLMHHLLTGRSPYGLLDSPGSLAATMNMLTTPLPDPRILRADLSDRVAAWLRRALATDPAARYPDLESMLADSGL